MDGIIVQGQVSWNPTVYAYYIPQRMCVGIKVYGGGKEEVRTLPLHVFL